MIQKLISAEVAKCLECESLIIYYSASVGFPATCNKCGVPANVTLSAQERAQLQQQQQYRQQGPRVQTFRF